MNQSRNTTRGIVGGVLMFVLAVGTLAGCTGTGGNGGSGPAEPTPSTTRAAGGDAPTVWEKTISRLDPDGTLTKDAALAAYTLAIGPLPGVERPKGDPAPILSGTIALNALLAHWDELTEAQRQAISGGFGASGGAAARQVTTTPSPLPTGRISPCVNADSKDAGPYRALVDHAIAQITPRFGKLQRIRVFVRHDKKIDSNMKSTAAWAAPCSGTDLVWEGAHITSCVIHIQPDSDANHLPANDLRAMLIHETMHCFQEDRFDTPFLDYPVWYAEGLPSWAASVLGPPNSWSRGQWKRYIQPAATSLNALSYEGMGFFTHHAELGLDTWAMARRVGAALAHGGTASGWRAAALPPAFLNSWGSGFVQGDYPGTAWTSVGPNLEPVKPDLSEGEVVQGGRSLTAVASAYGAFAIRANVQAEVVEVSPSAGAEGRISLGYGGQDATLDVAKSKPYCTLDSWRCKCPKDSDRADVKFGLMDEGEQFVGVAGGAQSTSVTVSGMSLEDFCGKPGKSSKWRAVSVKSRSTLPQGPGNSDWHWNVDGGAGVKLTIDQKGNVSVDYTGMRKLSYTIPEVRQAGTVVCSGVDKGSLPAKSFNGSTGAWLPAIGAIGSSGTIDVTSPTPLHQSASPGSGGCRSIFRADPLHAGTWKRTPKSLTITTNENSPAGGRISTVWTFAPA